MSDATSVVGSQTHIVGNLKGEESLTVRGRVDGSITLARMLTVDASGIVVADVEVESAVIGGTVVGNITAADSIQIQPEGRVVGDLTAARVVLAEGAAFRGNVNMIGVEGAVKSRKSGSGNGKLTASRSASSNARKKKTAGRASEKNQSPRKTPTARASSRSARSKRAQAGRRQPRA